MSTEVKKRVFNPKVETRLARADINRLDEAAKVAKKSRADFARQALLWYLNNLDNLKAEERESPLERRIKKMEDRLAALMARTAIDVGTIFALLWRRTDQQDRKEVFNTCYMQAVKRLKKKLTGTDAEVKEIMKDAISS